METVRSRFVKTLRGELPDDRLPVVEWAMWWDQTIRRWRGEGLPAGLDDCGVKRFFGLDVDYQLWFPRSARPLEGVRSVGVPPGSWIATEADYEALRPHLYPDPVPFDRDLWRHRAAEHTRGEVVIWVTVCGFFWWPRELLGIEPHFYAFYDAPDLLHRINADQCAYAIRSLEAFCEICVPDFMTVAEDMSYNHGPMLSRAQFDTFLAPHYRRLMPYCRERGIVPIVDSDGDVEPLIPWLEEVGVEGILPLERMAGVDVSRVRATHPQWKMIGGFDKTVMHRGEEAIRAEFERLMPVMRSGGFIPSVDHQTPPEVSMEDYRLYLRLLREYAGVAVA